MNTKDMFNVVQCLYNSIPVISSSQFFIFFFIVYYCCYNLSVSDISTGSKLQHQFDFKTNMIKNIFKLCKIEA